MFSMQKNETLKIGSDSSTPLHKLAADKTQHQLLIELLKTDKQVNCKDHNGDYPLLLALQTGCSLEVYEALLAAGADIRVKTLMGRNALHCAVEKVCEIPVIESLCRSPLFNEKQDCCDTPLEYALYLGCPVDVFDVLWKHQPFVSYSPHCTNFLHLAVVGDCDVSIVDRIIDKYEWMVNLPETEGRLPIHFVSTNIEVCKALIRSGSDLWHKDKSGKIPLRYCIQMNCLSSPVVLEFLKQMDQDKLAEDEKSFGNSILYDACCLLECEGGTHIVETLLEAGLNPITKYKNGCAVKILSCDGFESVIRLRKYVSMLCLTLHCPNDCTCGLSSKIKNFLGNCEPKFSRYAREFTKDIIKWIAIQAWLSFPEIKPETREKYFKQCVMELETLRNFKLTNSKNLYDVILEHYMNSTLSTVTVKRRSYWQIFHKAMEFDASEVVIYKKEVTDVQSIVFACQMYNEQLCTRKEDNNIVFLTHLASEHIFDYLNKFDLQLLAKTLLRRPMF